METLLVIKKCESMLRFRCPMLWSELSQTASADVRHCAACDKDVFLCTTDEEVAEHAKAGHWIAREVQVEDQPPLMIVGKAFGPVKSEA